MTKSKFCRVKICWFGTFSKRQKDIRIKVEEKEHGRTMKTELLNFHLFSSHQLYAFHLVLIS
jgi:hypothetical protein